MFHFKLKIHNSQPEIQIQWKGKSGKYVNARVESGGCILHRTVPLSNIYKSAAALLSLVNRNMNFRSPFFFEKSVLSACPSRTRLCHFSPYGEFRKRNKWSTYFDVLLVGQPSSGPQNRHES